MQYTVLHYYKEFTCTAGKCPDTCCAGWKIMIDKNSLRKYKKTKTDFGNRLKNEIDWKEGSFRTYRGRCAFLNEENLCDIYREAGKEMLCRTCRQYPRHIEEYEGLREISLCLSCPEVAKIVLGMKEPVRFLTAETDKEERDYSEFDFFLYTKLMDARDLMIAVLQDRNHPIDARMAMVLSMSHDLQERIDKNTLSETEKLFVRYEQPEGLVWFQKRVEEIRKKEGYLKEKESIIRECFRLLDKLEVLKKEWPAYLSALRQRHDQKKRTSEKQAEKSGGRQMEIWTEQIMVYFLFTYFCGAVYDSDAYSKCKFSFVCTILLREMLWAMDIENMEEEKSLEEAADLVHQFAREVEHSDKNKKILEQLLRKENLFSLERLLETL